MNNKYKNLKKDLISFISNHNINIETKKKNLYQNQKI